jgi:hypothetical protein
MPEETILSAIPLTSSSLIFTWKVFQLFHPIGGVSAKPSNFWASLLILQKSSAIRNNLIFITVTIFEINTISYFEMEE